MFLSNSLGGDFEHGIILVVTVDFEQTRGSLIFVQGHPPTVSLTGPT